MANERVLVIDDGKDIREYVVEHILKPSGFQVLVARDGAEGLQKALREEPDFIICDMQMPRMTGLQVIQALAEQGKPIPSILVTAHGSEELAVAAFRAGAQDYVIKPFEADEILEAIERTLQAVRRRRETRLLDLGLSKASHELEGRLRELNTLFGIGKAVTSVLDLELILQRVVEAGVYLTGAEEGSLFLLDDETEELTIRAAKNLESELVSTTRLKVHDSLAGRVIHTGEPLLIGDQGWQKIKTAYLVKSLLYVPLRIQGRVIGVLGLHNRVKADHFTQEHQHLLSVLGDYAAIAIENARLFTSTEAERSKLEAILRETEDLVVVVDQEGRVDLMNKAAQAAFGADDTALGSPFETALDQAQLIALLELEPAGRSTLRAEIRLKDGRTFNAHLTAISSVGKAVVMQDITHLKELDRIKSEFVSIVSHDLRSPLTSILGYVELLSRAGPVNEMQEQFIERVQRSVHNITALIADLLDLGRIEAGFDLEMQVYQLDHLVREVVDSLHPTAEGKGLTLRAQLPPILPPNWGNPLRIRQAISNIVGNAVKYTPEGGEVVVEAHRENSQVVLRVSDTGIGIAPADQPYIFDKFYRAESVTDSHQGTGLGLSIVKSVVERHRGRIWAESEPGRGSTFTFILPIISQPEPDRVQPPAPSVGA